MRENTAWDAMLPSLTDAYLQYIAPSPLAAGCPPTTKPSPQFSHTQTPSDTARPSSPDSSPFTTTVDHEMADAASASPELVPYTVRVYDLFTLQSQLTIMRSQNSVSPAADLMKQGYIAKTPTLPEVVVSVKTVQLLHRLRQRKASLSIEAFAKVVCDYYNVRHPSVHP